MIGIIRTIDIRNDHLIKLLLNKNIILSDNINDFLNIDILICPPNGVDYLLYFKNSNISLTSLFKNNPGLKKIITCFHNENLKIFCTNNNIELIVVFADNIMLHKKAQLTSEALIRLIFENLKCSLADLRILIIGNDYQSLIIHKHLNAFTKNILTTYELTENPLTDIDIIINTVNKHILTKENLKTLNKNVKIYDITSYPFGFDLLLMHDLGIKVEIISDITRYIIPISFSKLVAQEINKYL